MKENGYLCNRIGSCSRQVALGENKQAVEPVQEAPDENKQPPGEII